MFLDAIAIIGTCLEVIGVFLMSGAYMSAVRVTQKLKVLFVSLYRGRSAKGAVDLSGLNETQKVNALQGLAFIGLGFICQTGVMLWKFVASHFLSGG